MLRSVYGHVWVADACIRCMLQMCSDAAMLSDAAHPHTHTRPHLRLYMVHTKDGSDADAVTCSVHAHDGSE